MKSKKSKKLENVMQKLIKLGILIGIIFLYPISLYAYVGPGMGGGMLAAFFGIVGAILLAIAA